MRKLLLAFAAIAAVLGAKAELPAGYTALPYISSTDGGKQWINTRYIPSCTDKIELKVVFHKKATQSFFCSRTGSKTTDNTFTCFYIDNSGYKIRFDRKSTSNLVYSKDIVETGVPHEIVVDGSTCKCTLDGVQTATMNSGNDFELTSMLTVFAGHSSKVTETTTTSGINNFTFCSMYYFKVTDKDGNVKVDLAPCGRNSDGTIGMYDCQRGMFFSSQGDEAFACADVGNYTFTGGAGTGDLSEALNWDGDRLPNLFDNATVDGKTAGRNDFTRSGVFGVKALSFLNWTNGMLLDLNNGSISAQTLTIGGAGPVVVSNGTVDVSGKVKVNASSVMTVAEGATINTPDSVALDAELLVDKNGKLVIDGGAYNAPCTTGNSYGRGNTFGNQDYGGSPGYLEVKNGGSYSVPSVGRAQVTTFANSKIVVTDDSTFDISKGNNYSFSLGTVQKGNVYAVTNSVFKWFKWRVGYIGTTGVAASNSRFYFHDSMVSSSQPLSDNYNWGVEIQSDSTGNQWLLDGTDNKSSFSTKFDGTKNSITVKDGEHSGQVLLQNGTGNSFTLDGATYTSGCSLSLNGGRENVFCVKNGATVSPSLNPTIGGVSNRLEISGSKFGARSQTINYAFNGEAFQYKLLDNAEGHIGRWGDEAAMTFGSKAKDTLISIDNSTLVTEGYVDLSGATLPSGIVFEFRGGSPRWNPLFWQDCRHNLITLGAGDVANKDVAPRFRFVLPETPYVRAPVDVTSGLGTWGVLVNPTAKLEFDFSQIGESKQRRVYPLISGASASIDQYSAKPLTQEIVDQIAANSNLPEGCTLVYSDWVLSLRVRGTAGLIIVIK